MSRLHLFIDHHILPAAMLLGVVSYRWCFRLGWLLPYLIFLMLFFTFCKTDPRDMRLHTWHWIALGIQLVLAAMVYIGMVALSHCSVIRSWLPADMWDIMAQSMMLCVLMPTATAGPIVAGKLGGSVQNLTTFTIMSNMLTALLVPAVFPLVNPAAHIDFWNAAGIILARVSPLLIGPFLLAWLVRIVYNEWQRVHHSPKRFHLPHSIASVPFYIWTITLVILMASITDTVVSSSSPVLLVVLLSCGALLMCVLQFRLGSRIGSRWPAPKQGDEYQDDVIGQAVTNHVEVMRITTRQAFGQKNTTLGVWMAMQFLLPLTSIGPAAYIIWQNMINSWELQHKK